MRKALSDSLKARVWLISDLQQSEPEKSRRCLYTALDDFESLGLKCDKIWYLGDSVEGSDMEHLDKMTSMQEEAFEKLGIPLCYVLGNHDTDPLPESGRVPFYDMLKHHKEWKCIETCEDYYFFDKIAMFDVLFISDHFAKDFSWRARHGGVYEDRSKYPHKKEDFEALMKKVEKSGRTTITVSHYSFPGGNRSSNFMGMFMPIPKNVFMHLYGHAHIGDKVWAGKDAMRKIAWADDSDVPQLDISSLEHGRGNTIRSAFLEIYDDMVMVLFRDHEKREWTESFLKRIF